MRSNTIKSQIERARELATEKLAVFNQELASIQAELETAKKETTKAKVAIEKGGTPKNVAFFKGRKQFLQMKLEAVEKARDEALAAKDNLIALKREHLDAEQRGMFERMRGLLACPYGQSTADSRLLYDTLGDYLEATDDSDRKAALKAINLIFEHGNLGDPRDGKAGAGDEVLRRFEAISDPEERTAFYNKHTAEIAAAYDRKNLNWAPRCREWVSASDFILWEARGARS